tara:strand:+ start:688 stop:1434 length:747 start_codon:yes stop_codon:yes gene_type:complete
MTNKYRYFIGNWKMFGQLSSIKILKRVNSYLNKVKNNNSKVIFCPPYTLINSFAKQLKKSLISIGAQNCHHESNFGPHTGSINSKMIKNSGAKYVIIGHYENRIRGDTDLLINKKIKASLNNKLKIIFCIGENRKQKNKRITNKILNKQITIGLKGINKKSEIFVAYEPIWAIGTGLVPNTSNLKKNLKFIQTKLKKILNNYKILYGGSVNHKTVKAISSIGNVDGFLIGGASQSSKKFIDIIKNSYK